MEHWKRKIKSEFFEYLRLFLLLGLLIIVLVCGIQLVFARQIMKRAAYENSANTLLLFRESQEAILRQIGRSMDGVFTNTLFQQYMQLYENHEYYTLQSIAEQLENIVKSQEAIDSVYLYYRKYDYTLSSDSGPAPLSRHKEAAFLQSLDDLDFKYGVTMRREMIQENEGKATACITVVRTLPLFYTTPYPDAYVVININNQGLNEFIQDININSNEFMMVLDENNNVIIGPGEEQEPGPELFNQISATQEVTHVQLPIDGDEMLITYVEAPDSGWTYLYAQPLAEVMGGISGVESILFLAAAMALALSVILSVLFSKRIFQPIQRISDKLERVQRTEEDRYVRRQDLINHRIDAILALNAALEAKQAQQLLTEQETAFVKFVKEQLPMDKAGQMLEWLKNKFDTTDVLTLATADVNLSEQEVSDNLFFGPTWSLVLKVSPSAEETILLLKAPSNSVQLMHVFRTETPTPRQCSVGISMTFTELSDLPVAYRQSVVALDMRVVKGRGRLYLYNPARVQPLLNYPISIENTLFKALRTDDMTAADAAVDAFERYLVENDAPSDMVRSYYVLLFTTIQRILYSLSDAQDFLAGMSPQTLMSMNSITCMSDYIKQLYTEALSKAEKQLQTYSPLVSSAISYIDAHLDGDLSIDSISSILGVSSSSLRKIFKSQMQCTMKEYINNKRIEVAKQMLSQGDMKVQEIASKLGFYYSQSFIAFFKSMVGITPGDYQQQLWQQKELTSDKDRKELP